MVNLIGIYINVLYYSKVKKDKDNYLTVRILCSRANRLYITVANTYHYIYMHIANNYTSALHTLIITLVL